MELTVLFFGEDYSLLQRIQKLTMMNLVVFVA